MHRVFTRNILKTVNGHSYFKQTCWCETFAITSFLLQPTHDTIPGRFYGKLNYTLPKGFSYDKQTAIFKAEDGVRISRLCEDNRLLTSGIDGVTTVHDCFQRGVRLAGEKPFLGWKPTPDTPYQWMTYNEVNTRAKEFGDGLIKLGLEANNETRVGIYSQNRPEYMIADQGLMNHSMTIVPMYNTLAMDACTFIVNQADLHVIVCDNNDKVKNLLERRKAMPDIRSLIVFEKPDEGLVKTADGEGIRVQHIDEVERLGRENPVKSTLPKPDDLALVCYTSGTTGAPKGVMLTHRNMTVCVSALTKSFNSFNINLTTEDVLMSYLPLAHSYERLVECSVITGGGRIGYYQGDVVTLIQDIKELRPTFFPSVPRLLNRLHDRTMAAVNASSFKKVLFKMALDAKTKELNRGVIRNDSIWDKYVFKAVQAGLGGRCRLIVTASAPISPAVMKTLRCIVGCPVLEGYGLTENTGAATVTMVGDNETGHVGPPIPSLMVKLKDEPDMNYFSSNNQGEVCLKGGNVFVGYLKDEGRTDEALDKDGWLHTGDIGEWLPSGALKIIDRKKNIYKLAQGEKIAPNKIENIIIQSPYLAQVYVHGDSLQSFLVCVVVPDPTTFPDLAKKVGASGSIEELARNEAVKRALLEDVTEIAKTNGLSSLEQVKSLHIFPELFSVENGLLTPTFKLKRVYAKKFFAGEIEQMYISATETKP